MIIFNNSIRLLLLVAVAVLSVFSETASAQAYCALRDPVRRVYELFPEADSYRTIIATVGPEHRQFLEDNLPFAHHFNEFGRHSLYVAIRDSEPLGLIHVRSERGRWGLVEVCWALDLDLNVRGFEFQRCRDPQGDALIASQFAKSLVGADLDTLKSRLEGGGYIASLPESLQPLAETVLRSGLKTVILTQDVWQDELIELRAAVRAREMFGEQADLEARDPMVNESPAVGFKLTFRGYWVVRNDEGEIVGSLIVTTIDLPGMKGDLWWVIGPEGRLQNIMPERSWNDSRTEAAFAELRGRTINDFEDCATAAELVAEAVLVKQDRP